MFFVDELMENRGLGRYSDKMCAEKLTKIPLISTNPTIEFGHSAHSAKIFGICWKKNLTGRPLSIYLSI